MDFKAAGLLLYALQTASANLKRTSFEPELPTQVVIDWGCGGRRSIGATAWSTAEGRECDDLAAAKDGSEEIDPALKLLFEGLGIGPEALDELGEDEEGEDDESEESVGIPGVSGGGEGVVG